MWGLSCGLRWEGGQGQRGPEPGMATRLLLSVLKSRTQQAGVPDHSLPENGDRGQFLHKGPWGQGQK